MMNFRKRIGLACLPMIALFFGASAAVASTSQEAAACLLDDASEGALRVFYGTAENGFKPAPADERDFNLRMLKCERQFGWARQTTFNAGAHAGFVLRFREQEELAASRGISQARRATLMQGARLFHDGPLRRDEWSAFWAWLSRNSSLSWSDFRTSREFPYFDAYAKVLSSAHKFESGQ